MLDSKSHSRNSSFAGHFLKMSQSLVFIGLICVIVQRVDSRHVSKPQHFARKSIAEPSMIFGDPNQKSSMDLLFASETETGESPMNSEFAEDSNFMTELIRRRFTRSPKAETKDEDDSDEEDEKDDESKSTEDDDINENDNDEKKPSTTTTTVRSTTKAAPGSGNNGTTPPSVSPQGRGLPETNLSSGTNATTPKSVPAVATGGPGNQTQVRPPPTANGTAVSPPNGTQVRPPTGNVTRRIIGRPPPGFTLPPGARPLPPGARPLPPGMRPPAGIPPHLLLGKGGGASKPLSKKGELYLPEDYNNLEIPKLDVGRFLGIKQDKLAPVPVLVFLNIRSIRDIDETNYEMVLDMDMKVEWVDGKLFDPLNALNQQKSKQITLNPVFLKKIWKPDIYIDEIVKVRKPSLMAKPRTLLFSPGNGLVSYTMRLTVRLSCEMDFNYYPSDTQRCEFHLRSYSFFDTDLNLSWLRNGVFLQDPSDPNFELQVSSIETLKIDQTFHEKKNNSYDGLKFTILARRKLSFHMVQTYLPSVFFIVITWLCFLVPARMVEARIGISMTTLLTLTAMFSSVRESTPIVSYVKAIDVWMVFCIFFVFLTLLEFSLLVWIRSFREDAEEKKLEQERQRLEKRGKSMKSGKNGRERTPSPSPSVRSEELKRYEQIAEFTEKWAFLIFSFVFLVFNIIYWSWLLIESNYFDWSVNATYNGLLDD